MILNGADGRDGQEEGDVEIRHEKRRPNPLARHVAGSRRPPDARRASLTCSRAFNLLSTLPSPSVRPPA
jgi:hypothetical protein